MKASEKNWELAPARFGSSANLNLLEIETMTKTTLDYMLADGGFIEAARALHWYCTDWHEGQSSDLYAIQCELRYSPSRLDNGEFTGNDDDTARDCYAMLRDGEIDAQELMDAIQAVQEAYNG